MSVKHLLKKNYIKKDKDKYQTPKDFYDTLDKEFHFNFDPCPINWNPKTHVDGLSIDWKTSTFCNPPYSNASAWIKKASEESAKGKLVVMLINAITSSRAFHEYIYNKPHVEIRFVKGRLKFIDPENPNMNQANPAASMVVIFRPH